MNYSQRQLKRAEEMVVEAIGVGEKAYHFRVKWVSPKGRTYVNEVSWNYNNLPMWMTDIKTALFCSCMWCTMEKPKFCANKLAVIKFVEIRLQNIDPIWDKIKRGEVVF